MAPSPNNLSPAQVVDIRGQRVRPEIRPVLADPTGVRRRRLARFGRAIAVLCMLWIAGLGLAGLGILPAGDLPLGHALTGTGPAALRVAPTPTRPRRSGLVAATPARAGTFPATAGFAAEVRAGSRAQSVAPNRSRGSAGAGRSHHGSPATGGDGSSAPASALGPITGAAGSTSAPGPIPTAGGTSEPLVGQSIGVSRGPHSIGQGKIVAPGQTVEQTTPSNSSRPARGNSATAPGQLKQTARTPGRSGTSPGHTVTHGSGHAKGG
jgi:hypothetical protein